MCYYGLTAVQTVVKRNSTFYQLAIDLSVKVCGYRLSPLITINIYKLKNGTVKTVKSLDARLANSYP